jgi:hypothetical protein
LSSVLAHAFAGGMVGRVRSRRRSPDSADFADALTGNGLVSSSFSLR